MIFGQDRDELRRMYARAWQKRTAGAPLSALESQIAEVIELHPEYQPVVTIGDVGRDYTPEAGETNPYLHMGLHLGLREQIATDRPAGIREIYRALAARIGDAHAAEHRMIDCLAEALWDAQRRNAAPDERGYLEKLRRLGGRES